MCFLQARERFNYPQAACSRLLASLFALLVLLSLVLLVLVTRVRAYEADASCLLRLADHFDLVDYVLFRLLLAARRGVVVALRITGGVHGRATDPRAAPTRLMSVTTLA